MARIQIDTTAPDFTHDDFEGHKVALVDYRERKHLVLVFNRGFF